MMKPKILIAMHYMHLGGAEISLVGLLQAFDPEKVDVDLFVYSHEGELMKFIPKTVNVLPEIPVYSMFERPLSEVLRKGYVRMLCARLKAKNQTRRYLKKHPAQYGDSSYGFLGADVSRVVPDIQPSVEYDLAISFLSPHDFVNDHVRAKKKMAWIHTDFTRINVNVPKVFPVWGSYDYIASISPDVAKTFLTVFPSLSGKIVEIENILSVSFVRRRAEEFVVDWSKENGTGAERIDCQGDKRRCLRILSIGRFCEQKNFDNLPFICSKLIEEIKKVGSIEQEKCGQDGNCMIDNEPCVKWYIMGFGSDEGLIRQKIVEAGMQEHVIILGKRANPYPYIKACDVYVQPSRYEGKSVTVREVQMLCKPVAVTNYPTAASQIQDSVDGVIVPMDNDGCAKGLAAFIFDTEKQKRITEYLKNHDYGNENEVEKIYDLLGC